MTGKESASFSKAIGLTAKLLGIYFNEALHNSGLQLTLNQFIVLRILSQTDGLCQNDLALITARDKTSLTRLVKTMESKGLVKRIINKHDKRKRKVFITDAGTTMLTRAIPIMTSQQQNAQRGIEEEKMQTLMNVLKQVQANIAPGEKGIKTNK